MQEIINSYVTDEAAQLKLQALAVSSPDSDGFSLNDGLIKLNGRVWVGQNSAVQTKIIHALHASALGGHSGIPVTLRRLKQLFDWQGTMATVHKFVQSCLVCQQSKPDRAKYPGLLQPLPVPDAAWQVVSLDFIEGMPRSGRYNSILVVVDKFSRYAHFIPLSHPFTAETVAMAFMDNIF
jgi:hypothetical protein